MKKNIYKLLSLPALLLAPGLLAAGNPAQQSAADTAGYRDIYPDTWVATDAVGRTMPSYEEVGAVKNDQRRIVGIFYITCRPTIRCGRKVRTTTPNRKWVTSSARTNG